ncbi:TPR domain-containing protein, putative [Eimeria mitis]|uniref:TPR domain-containing protein, putative n=1 Tax=Eimeria mitis TaxID=44415 RepID=U6JV32_9EIME|nr:TPR domain-containing protein, putative [Eimeria mitis]CDJ29289.1 TPR domain-containing protein, putative [Eimeria mitis]
MTEKATPFRGSGIATVGGEAPVEQCPQDKFCVEEDSPLCDSIMWKMLDNYYKQVAIEAWAHDYVPSFVTSNSRLITPGAAENEFERALVSIYSPLEEKELDAPAIMLRMTLGWKWRSVDLEAACDPSSPANIPYLQRDPTIKEVLLRYRKLNKQLSFVLPIGAFALFRNLSHIGGGRLFCLVGDKGYPTADEFVGVRDPHIAIHGSISFMLNLHAIRTFFDCMGGFSHATPYRDTFQVTGLWLCGTEFEMGRSVTAFLEDVEDLAPDVGGWATLCSGLWLCGTEFEMGRSVTAFLEDVEDLAPDGLINWQRAAQETVAAGGGPASNIKSLISLLRYSGHDADVFLNFSNEFTSQSVHPYLNPRTEQDLLLDLDEAFSNWYKLKKAEDVADLCGHICMRLGKCDKALKYLQASANLDGERLHPSTCVNLASCYKVEGKFEAGITWCEKALQIDPNYAQAAQMLRTLNMCKNPVRIAVIGFGYWTQYEALPLLRRDTRLKIVAAFAFTQEEAAALIQKGELTEAEMYSGSQGLTSLLERTDIQAVVVDVHMQLMLFYFVVDVSTPTHLRYGQARADAVSHAAEPCKRVGPLRRLQAVQQLADHLALDLLRCIAAVRQLTGLQLSSVSAAAKGDYAPCATGSFSPSDEGDSFKQEKLKNTRLRREYARLTGWLTLINPGGQTSTLGSFVISHCVGDNSLTYQINCVKGSNEGAPARFRCLAPPSAESVSKTEKKAASLRSLSSQQSAARA